VRVARARPMDDLARAEAGGKAARKARNDPCRTLLPPCFHTSTAQEASLESSRRAELAAQQERIARRELETGDPPKYLAHVDPYVRVFLRSPMCKSWHLKGSNEQLDAAAGAPADVACTYKLRSDWTRFLDDEARACLISSDPSNVSACCIAFAMGCSRTSRLSSACPPGMQGLPSELMKKICFIAFSTAFSTAIEVTFEPETGDGAIEVPEKTVLKVGSRTIDLFTDLETKAYGSF